MRISFVNKEKSCGFLYSTFQRPKQGRTLICLLNQIERERKKKKLKKKKKKKKKKMKKKKKKKKKRRRRRRRRRR